MTSPPVCAWIEITALRLGSWRTDKALPDLNKTSAESRPYRAGARSLKRWTAARNVGSGDSIWQFVTLPGKPMVLPRPSARRFALLEKAGVVEHEDRVVICQCSMT